MNKRVALAQLSMCLQGHVPPHADWMSILDLANRGLATAQLSAALLTSSDAGSVPSDVRVFLLDVQSRNRERNRRLVVQLCDSLRALNAVGVVPVLLKGIALWASRPVYELDRILTENDLLVRPADVQRSVDELKNAAFALTTQRPGSEAHVDAELGRTRDD